MLLAKATQVVLGGETCPTDDLRTEEELDLLTSQERIPHVNLKRKSRRRSKGGASRRLHDAGGRNKPHRLVPDEENKIGVLAMVCN